MTALRKAELLIAEMSKLEKAQLLYRIVAELTGTFQGIEKTPGVCGGDARISRTRIPVWSLINAGRLGFTDEQLLKEFPSLTLQDLQNACIYYRANQEEIDGLIEENDSDASEQVMA